MGDHGGNDEDVGGISPSDSNKDHGEDGQPRRGGRLVFDPGRRGCRGGGVIANSVIYIRRQQATIAEYIATHPIFELCIRGGKTFGIQSYPEVLGAGTNTVDI